MKALIAGLLALPVLAACNTVEGVGKDVEATGRAVSEAAAEVKDDISDDDDD